MWKKEKLALCTNQVKIYRLGGKKNLLTLFRLGFLRVAQLGRGGGGGSARGL